MHREGKRYWNADSRFWVLVPGLVRRWGVFDCWNGSGLLALEEVLLTKALGRTGWLVAWSFGLGVRTGRWGAIISVDQWRGPLGVLGWKVRLRRPMGDCLMFGLRAVRFLDRLVLSTRWESG